MKALKTIVATAVIVFSLTTVAMAGVQKFSGAVGGGTQTRAATTAAAQPEVAQPAGVTLSAQQFATLLHSLGRDAAPSRSRDTSQAQDRDRAQDHERQQARTHAGDGATTTTTASHHATTTHRTTHHAAVHGTSTYSGGTHDGGTHDGGHDGGCD